MLVRSGGGHDNVDVDDARPLLEVTGATVRFGAESALDEVDFRLFPGEVHSLMGENGAGKSTLVKAITGALAMDGGTLRLAGEEVRFTSPHAAQAAGISAVYQEIELLANVSVAENIALGREARRFGVVDWRTMRRSAAAVLHDLGLDVDPASILGTHPLAVQQLVAIARAITTDVQVLVLDEPTSSLDLNEVAELFRVINELKQRGVAILFVSHFLDQVYEISDRITWRSCSCRTSSTRSTRSVTGSRCCATAGWSGSTTGPNCCAWTWCRRCSARKPLPIVPAPARRRRQVRRRPSSAPAA